MRWVRPRECIVALSHIGLSDENQIKWKREDYIVILNVRWQPLVPCSKVKSSCDGTPNHLESDVVRFRSRWQRLQYLIEGLICLWERGMDKPCSSQGECFVKYKSFLSEAYHHCHWLRSSSSELQKSLKARCWLHSSCLRSTTAFQH